MWSVNTCGNVMEVWFNSVLYPGGHFTRSSHWHLIESQYFYFITQMTQSILLQPVRNSIWKLAFHNKTTDGIGRIYNQTLVVVSLLVLGWKSERYVLQIQFIVFSESAHHMITSNSWSLPNAKESLYIALKSEVFAVQHLLLYIQAYTLNTVYCKKLLSCIN
jgi:hypothetical protein